MDPPIDRPRLIKKACDELGVKNPPNIFKSLSAIELGNLSHERIVSHIRNYFPPGTFTASDLANQIHLCRAFSDPKTATAHIAEYVSSAVKKFPQTADDIKLGHNPGDVLDPFLLAANFHLLSNRQMDKTLESITSHKVLMKIEDMVGHMHEGVIGAMRGNFRIPEPRGKKNKEKIDPVLNPFPGADVGQVPTSDKPKTLRLFQIKSKTGSAKGGDGVRLGNQLRQLEEIYSADTFYVAVVGNTLKGHRSRGAVERESPNTAILVGETALNELTQSSIGGELLLQSYQRAFRQVSEECGYNFEEIVTDICELFKKDNGEGDEQDLITQLLHNSIGGSPEHQDSRYQ